MPQPIPVVLLSYDPEWPRMAASFAERLRVLGPTLVTVHHIGSTSVPGLAAKPIIDLMPLVTDLAALDRQRGVLESAGLEWHGEFGIPGRRYCTLSSNIGLRIAQYHFYEVASAQIERHIAFRDYLRAHPDTAAAYEKEKCRAGAIHPDNSHAYNDEKDAWIKEVEAKAIAWFCRSKRP